MVIRVSRYVAINTPSDAGAGGELPPFSPEDFFIGGLPGYWQGTLTVETIFNPAYLFGNGQPGNWAGGYAPSEG